MSCRRLIAISAAVAVLLVLCFLSVCFGGSSFDAGRSLSALFGWGDERDVFAVWGLRVPHILAAIVCGSGLAVAGCLYQCALRNPLASASTLGVTNGAAFGASIAIAFFGAGFASTPSLLRFTAFGFLEVVAFAFAGALLSAFLVVLLSSLAKASSESMILVGIALSAMFQGGVALVQYFADGSQVAAVVFWMFGNLGRVSYWEICLIAIVVFASCAFSCACAWRFDALQLGDVAAKNLGIGVLRLRVLAVGVASLLTACIVSFVGVISFVGLVAPHIMRTVSDGSYRFLIPASSVAGAALLLAGDFAARCVAAPVVLPVDAITSLFGAPLLLFLLLGRRRSA